MEWNGWKSLKMIGSVAQSGLASLQQASERLDSTLMRMASGDLDSLPEDIVDLSIAKTQVSIGVRLLRIQDDTTRSLLDLLV